MEEESVKVIVSPANGLIKQDWVKWRSNTLRFFLPVLTIYLGYVSQNLNDGFSWMDFIPNTFVAGTMSLYIVNTLQDLITKYSNEDKYADGKLT